MQSGAKHDLRAFRGILRLDFLDRDLPPIETLRPLVASSLRSGRYSPGPACGFL